MKKPEKEAKERVLEHVNRVNSGEYEYSDDYTKLKKKTEVKKGRKSRASGASFELKVRRDLEDKGWIVDKWSNNVDLEEEKVVPAKRKYNPFKKALVIGTGFPDFITLKKIHNSSYGVEGVEVKKNGLLSKEEKEKCRFLLKGEIFSKIWVAKSVMNGRKINIDYIDFKEKYGI